MTLRTGDDILIWRRRLCIALYGGIVLEEALDLSSDRILNEWMNVTTTLSQAQNNSKSLCVSASCWPARNRRSISTQTQATQTTPKAGSTFHWKSEAESTAGTKAQIWRCCSIISFDVEYIYGFVWWGGLQAKSMTSQRDRAVTRWRICVTMATLWQQQDGGYALLFYIFNSTVIDWTFFMSFSKILYTCISLQLHQLPVH